MAVRFTTAIELEVTVHGSVDFPVAPEGWDPGDPGGCELEAVMLTKKGQPGLNLLGHLPPEAMAELEAQLFHAAEEQAEDAYVAAMEARADARREGER